MAYCFYSSRWRKRAGVDIVFDRTEHFFSLLDQTYKIDVISEIKLGKSTFLRDQMVVDFFVLKNVFQLIALFFKTGKWFNCDLGPIVIFDAHQIEFCPDKIRIFL